MCQVKSHILLGQESHTSRRIICITNCPQYTYDTEMATPMNIWEVEIRHILHSFRERREVGLGKDMIHQTLLRKAVHDPRDEVSGQAMRSRIVNAELISRERTSRNTSSSCSSRKTKNVDAVVGWQIWSVASKASHGIEHWRVVHSHACLVARDVE